jgi:hypothetical protein
MKTALCEKRYYDVAGGWAASFIHEALTAEGTNPRPKTSRGRSFLGRILLRTRAATCAGLLFLAGRFRKVAIPCSSDDVLSRGSCHLIVVQMFKENSLMLFLFIVVLNIQKPKICVLLQTFPLILAYIRSFLLIFLLQYS